MGMIFGWALVGATLALALPALADAKTVTIGPRMQPSLNISEGCAFEHPDCGYVQSALPKSLLVRIPANGTITAWRVEGFKGTARLLIFKAHHGRYTIVSRSRAHHKRCVVTNSSGICGPAFSTVYTFSTHQPARKDEFIGIELISPANCNTTPDDQACADIGVFTGFTTNPVKGASGKYFDPTPALRHATNPKQSTSGEIMVNADLKTG